MPIIRVPTRERTMPEYSSRNKVYSRLPELDQGRREVGQEHSSRNKLPSGLPLGGIGAGKMELFPNGLLGVANLYNNWENPTRWRLSPYFAIRIKTGRRREAVLLEAGTSDTFHMVTSIKLNGRFPIARLQYKITNLPLELNLKAWSSFIPGEYKDSGIPGILFEFSVYNPTKETTDVSLLGWMVNTSGTYLGRYNTLRQNKDLIQVVCKAKNTLPTDLAKGELSFGLDKQDVKVSYICNLNES